MEEADGYLDALVDMEDDIEGVRGKKTKKSPVQVKNAGQTNGHAAPMVNGNGINGVHSRIADIHGDGDHIITLEQGSHGKTVKDLSRLWKYLGGGSPTE